MAQCSHPYQKSDERAHDERFSGENLHRAELRQFHMWQNWCLVFANCCWVEAGEAELILAVVPQSTMETTL